MRFGRVLGWLLVLAALVVLAGDALSWLEAGSWNGRAAGDIWYQLDAASLNGAQALIQRYVWPALWEPGIVTVLAWPAWLVLGLPGGLLAWLCRRPAKRRRRSSRFG